MIKTTGSNTNADDLDLWALISNAVSFFRRYGIILLIAGLSGLVAGIVIYSALPKVYSSKLILESTLLSNLEEIQLVNSWNDLLNKDGYSILAENFNCDPHVVEKVNKITAEQIQKGTNNDNSSGFIIEVFIRDTTLLEELQKGLVYGLENSEYVSQRIGIKRKNLEQLIISVNQERIKLDSIKSNVEDILRNKKKNNSSLMIDVSGISSQMILLQEKSLTYQENLKFIDPVRVLQKFVKFRHPKQPKLINLALFGLIGGLGIGYLFAFYKIFRRKYVLYKE
ncbi:hypothetical protein ACX0G9_11385 [Flavitalea flava]